MARKYGVHLYCANADFRSGATDADNDGSARSGDLHHFAVGPSGLVHRRHPESPQTAAVGREYGGNMKVTLAGRLADNARHE